MARFFCAAMGALNKAMEEDLPSGGPCAIIQEKVTAVPEAEGTGSS